MAVLDKGGATAEVSAGADRRVGTTGVTSFIAGSVLLGTIGIFVHEAHADPLTTTWFRCAFGCVGLTVWIVHRKQAAHLLLSARLWPWAMAMGMLMVLGWILFFAAIARTSAGMATVLFQVQPFWVLVLGACLLKEPIARLRLASVMAAMVGLILATGIVNQLTTSTGASATSASYWTGVEFSLAGALLAACATIIARRLRQVPAVVLAWWQCAVGTICLLAWPLNGWPTGADAWLWLSGLGLLHTGLAYTLIYGGMSHLVTDRIAALQFVYPGVAIVVDWLVYGHRLDALQIAGVCLMALSVWFGERFAGRRR